MDGSHLFGMLLSAKAVPAWANKINTTNPAIKNDGAFMLRTPWQNGHSNQTVA
jgi:hypothetical protein